MAFIHKTNLRSIPIKQTKKMFEVEMTIFCRNLSRIAYVENISFHFNLPDSFSLTLILSSPSLNRVLSPSVSKRS